MLNPLSLYIGLRYIRAKRRNGFVSFISFASTLGIALGVTVLITVLSVMNGFDQEIRTRFFATAPQVTVKTEENIQTTWPGLADTLHRVPGVQSVAPYVSGEGILINGRLMRGVSVMGVLENDDLRPGEFKVVLPQSLTNALTLRTGSAVNLLTAQATTTPLGLFPRYRQITVAGTYTDERIGNIETPIYMAMDDVQKLFAAGRHISGLHLQLRDVYQAPKISQKIQALLPPGYSVTNWTIESGAFFQALAMEKIMIFIILLFIIAIAAFNLISMLIMVVHEKQADIAILRTLGATPGMIRDIFILQGSVLGAVGTLFGLGGGILLSWQVTPVVNALQRWFHIQFIPTSAYWANVLPSKIMLQDVVTVCLIAFGLSVLATLYPAIVAFRIQPAEALRYE